MAVRLLEARIYLHTQKSYVPTLTHSRVRLAREPVQYADGDFGQVWVMGWDKSWETG